MREVLTFVFLIIYTVTSLYIGFSDCSDAAYHLGNQTAHFAAFAIILITFIIPADRALHWLHTINKFITLALLVLIGAELIDEVRAINTGEQRYHDYIMPIAALVLTLYLIVKWRKSLMKY